MPSPPPNPASPEPSANVRANTRLTLMPRPAAAVALSTLARTWLPNRVFSMMYCSATVSAATTTIRKMPVDAEVEPEKVHLAAQVRRQRHRLLRRAEEIRRDRDRHEHEADREQHLVEVARLVQSLVERPLEDDADDGRRDERDGQRREERHAEPRHQQHADVTADHRERAVREVDEVHQPERHRQPDGDDEQQAAVRDAVEQHADDVADHGGLATVPAGVTCRGP